MRCITISASDDRMDCRDTFDDPINALPPKCSACGFPDLDQVPQPYFLIKSRTMTPMELALAENGNFFIRDRIRQVLDILAPNQCRYFPTYYQKTTQQTPWLLAVPSHQVPSAKVDESIPRCRGCGEPRSAHPGTQWGESLLRNSSSDSGWTCELDFDIVKSSTWGSSENGWDKWICRDLFLSVRLLHLLKKMKAKGFYEATCQKPTIPDKDELAWIQAKVRELKLAGIPNHAEGTLSEEDAHWFLQYLKGHNGAPGSICDTKPAEKRLKTKLPKSYTDFIRTVGQKQFKNVDEQAGFTVSILLPDELVLAGHSSESQDEESKAVNGVTFATTDHGDSFCFDVQKGKKEFSVFLFKHDYDCFEPYADNFAACIRRFAGGGPVIATA